MAANAAAPADAAVRSLPAVSATGLTKSYGDKAVLRGIDLEIPAGSVFALLGPNGAGKTTTVQILSTLIPADGGSARVAGHDVEREADGVRKAIGVTGQFSAVDNLLTAEENLLLMADLNHLRRREGRRRAEELLRRFDLTEASREAVATFSGGMRRKLDLAMTLVGDPRVIFLDEPTTGLDPRSRRTMWEIIRSLVADHGVTIFLTTQYLEEADQLADRIAVLDGGRIVAEGTAEELKRYAPGGRIRLRFTDAGSLAAAAVLFPYATADTEALRLEIPGDNSVLTVKAVLDALDNASVQAESLVVETADLDDVFLQLTGEGSR
ncbi:MULTISPECIES: ATP-binding cassette domain-containing protein [Streptomycetaceae]|uniref:ATP-binding cassette domain-containing protein n=1 Tax=Streptomycetaceae TaxID=2062 RepID=UPI00093C10F6|nr:ATP-binding cassette domain-containing protein [Streptomyces sp. CB02056]OKI01718.1 ABC transporter [Streptomyces sp. CB02056]